MSRLAPPPSSPNCVSSRTTPDDPHYIAPYAGGADPAATFARLKGLVRGLPRVSIEKDEPEYLHAVVRSLLFRFPDDIELELDGDLIHLRMASRVGHSDLGVNRKRAESLRAQLG